METHLQDAHLKKKSRSYNSTSNPIEIETCTVLSSGQVCMSSLDNVTNMVKANCARVRTTLVREPLNFKAIVLTYSFMC